jgi:hypothetical protein
MKTIKRCQPLNFESHTDAALTELANSGAAGYTVGAVKRFSKLTLGYLTYSALFNRANVQDNFTVGNIAPQGRWGFFMGFGFCGCERFS